MGKVTAIMSMSLDGFIAGRNHGVEHPLGEGGERLHRWLFSIDRSTPNRDAALADSLFVDVGAVVMGKDMYVCGEIPWGDDPPFSVPTFVVTHHPRETVVKKGVPSTFVTDGLHSAFAQARAVAGDKHIRVAGGANLIQQFIRAGLLDELQLQLIPVLLGGGRLLFEHLDNAPIELESTGVIEATGMMQLNYRIAR